MYIHTYTHTHWYPFVVYRIYYTRWRSLSDMFTSRLQKCSTFSDRMGDGLNHPHDWIHIHIMPWQRFWMKCLHIFPHLISIDLTLFLVHSFCNSIARYTLAWSAEYLARAPITKCACVVCQLCVYSCKFECTHTYTWSVDDTLAQCVWQYTNSEYSLSMSHI